MISLSAGTQFSYIVPLRHHIPKSSNSFTKLQKSKGIAILFYSYLGIINIYKKETS